MELSENKVALTFGFFISGVHLFWSLLIVVGWAQLLLDFIFWAHMIANPYKVLPFVLVQSVTLIVVTFVLGYFGGLIFAKIWNAMHR